MLQLINKLSNNFFENSWELIIFKLYSFHIEILIIFFILYAIWREFDKSNRLYIILAIINNKINEKKLINLKKRQELDQLKEQKPQEVLTNIDTSTNLPIPANTYYLDLVNWFCKKGYYTKSVSSKDPNHILHLDPIPQEKIEKANKLYFNFLSDTNKYIKPPFLKSIKHKKNLYDFSKYIEHPYDRIRDLTENQNVLYHMSRQDLWVKKLYLKEGGYPIYNFTEKNIYTPEYNRLQALKKLKNKKKSIIKKDIDMEIMQKNIEEKLLKLKSDKNYISNYIKHRNLLNKNSNKKYELYAKKYPEITKIIEQRIELSKEKFKIKIDKNKIKLNTDTDNKKIISDSNLEKFKLNSRKKLKGLEYYREMRIKKSLLQEKDIKIKTDKKQINNFDNNNNDNIKKNSLWQNIKDFFYNKKIKENDVLISSYQPSEKTTIAFHNYYENLKEQIKELQDIQERKLKICAEQEAINLKNYNKYIESWSTYKAHSNEEIDKKIKELGAEYLRKINKPYYPVSYREKYLLEQILGPQKKSEVWLNPLKNIKNYPAKVDPNLPCFQKEFWEKKKIINKIDKKNKYNKLIEYIERRKKFNSETKHMEFKFSDCQSDKEKIILFKKIHELRKIKKFNFTKHLNEKYNISIKDLEKIRNNNYWYKIRNKNRRKKYEHINGDIKNWQDSLWFEERKKKRLRDAGLSPHSDLILRWHRKEYSYYTWDYIIDQFLFSIPIFFIFCLIQLTFASIILTKFKCQQHYKIYHWILGLGPVIIGYILLYILNVPWLKALDKHYQWYISSYPKFNNIEWPIYIGLYQWWIFLMCYGLIVFIFYHLAPNSIYLRSNNIMKPWLVNRSFLLCFIFLLMPPLFSQERLPFWLNIKSLLFSNIGTQNYWGIHYLLLTFLLLGFCSIIFFHLIIIIPYLIKFLKTKNESYLKQIKYLLYLNIEDNRDWDFKEGVPKVLVDRRLQDFEIDDEDWDDDMQSYTLDGSFFYLPNKNNYYILKKGWKASLTKNIFIIWIILNFFLGVLTYILFQYKGFFITLILIYFFFLFLLIFLLFLILKFKLKTLLNTREYQIYFLISIFLNYQFIITFKSEFYYTIDYLLKLV